MAATITGHHRPEIFEIQDEQSLPIALSIYTGFAELVNGIGGKVK